MPAYATGSETGADAKCRAEHSFRAMGGPCRVRIHHEDADTIRKAFAAAESEVARLERKYSRFRDDSITTQINRRAGTGQPTSIDAETAGLLQYGETLYRESRGKFDLTSGILRRAWNFKDGGVPAQCDLEALLPRIGWHRVTWDAQTVYLPEPGMEIDFGGCVKEYACDSTRTILEGLGIRHALVDLAGDIATLGCQGNGAPWQVGIRHPRDRDSAIAQVPLQDLALASSGDYERSIEIKGVRYSHLLDPATGWPVQGLVAVSVVSPQCLVAGSASTIALLKPREEALQWLSELGLPWLAIDRNLECHGSIHVPA